MPFYLGKENRVRKTGEYRRIYDTGRKVSGRYLILFIAQAGGGNARFGLTVSGKVGKACERNRVRRRLKEALNIGLVSFSLGSEMVFVAKRGIREASFPELVRDVATLLQKASR